MFKKKEEPVIEFVSVIPGLEQIDECLPKPAKYFLPKWWNTVSNSPRFGDQNVKSCPSFPDYFSQGYIIPMWADTIIKYDKENDMWGVKSGLDNKTFPWTIHSPDQFLNMVDATVFGKDANFVFKAICPWNIITPKGWSVIQQPLYYHFNKKYSILPGIIDTDFHHQVNQQVLYHADGEEIFIKRGEPFAHYIPFKRQKIKSDVRYKNKEDIKRFNRVDASIQSKIMGEGSYRISQKSNNEN